MYNTVTLKAKFSLFPEGTDEGGSSADALENLSGGMSEIPKVFWTKVWQCVLLKVAPQVFHWVEFRRVSGHELDLQSLTLSGDKLGDDLAAVDRRAVPEDQEFSGQVAQEMAQEFDHLRAFDAAGMEGKIIVPPSQPGDGREAFPVEGKLQDRCLPPGGPSAHTVRLLTQPAFIEEEDGTALGARFFLSLASVAFSNARWPLHFVPGRGPPAAGSSSAAWPGCGRHGRGGI